MPAPVVLGRFNHASLVTADAERSAAFYERVLGLRRTARPEFDFAGAWLWSEGLGMMLHLIEEPGYQPTIEPGRRRNHLAFRVDVDEAKRRLDALGVAYREKRLPTHGFRQLFLDDPDGHQLELGEWPDAEELADLPAAPPG